MWKIPRCRKLVATVALVMLLGCGKAKQSLDWPTDTAPRPVANVALRIAIVNDAELVAAIAKLRGEWQARGGGELTVEEITFEQAQSDFDADLLVFPARYLGELCEAGRLRPMRQSILDSESLDFGDILPLVREREIVYGQQVMALPLGCPAPLVARADGVAVPAAPLADQFAAFALLARAAPLASHASREAIWFDPETMQPRLTEPPFVRALTELIATENTELSSCEMAEELLQEKIPAAIVWPCRASAARGLANLKIEQLPATTQVYNPAAAQWESTSPRQVTLLATSGRLVGVTAKSRNAASAFRLVGWLASPEVARQFATASKGLAICRTSQRQVADNWLGATRTGTARQFSEQLAEALSQREGVTVPRLPGVDRYLDALGDAVRTAARGTSTAEEAFAKAARDWERITNELDRDRQRAAYRRCLGIEPNSPAF